MKLRRNISQRTHPIYSIGSKTHVLGHFGPFRYCTKVDTKLAEQVPLTHKFAKQSRVGKFWNERTWFTSLDPKLIFWGISDRFVTARKSMLNEVVSENFTMDAPDPHRWTQNSCLGCFRLFCYCTKVDAKLAELAPLRHKFAKWSCVGILRNERY
jgi:hypothetical protein